MTERNRIKWFPPEQEPIDAAVVITKTGVRFWYCWDGAAPGKWEWWCRHYGVIKWRKKFRK